MSQKLPALRPTEVIRALERAGWRTHRQRGSHISLHREGARHVVTIPLHRSDLPKGTLHAIIRDAGLEIEEFLELL